MEIIGSIILSIAQSILFYGKEIGISMLLFEIIFNVIMCYIIYKKNKIQNKIGIILMIPILLLSCTYFIFANKTFYIANILIIIALNLIMYIILTNKKGFLTDHLYNTFKLVIDTITGCKEGIDLSQRKSKEYITVNSNISKEKIKKTAVSLLTVSVVVGIVLILLASADMIFANIFSGIDKLLKNINIGTTFSFILRIAIIIITYFLFLSLILKLQREYKKEEKEIKNSKEKYTFTIKLLLITLNIVYLVFCFIQVQSLFARININESFDYASYARSGFFQLMFVSFINFGIILISNSYNKKKEKIIELLNLLLVLFTIIIAISSMYRMYMYEMEYGLTYLRTFVYIILITEIISFIPITIYIFNQKFDFIKWCFAIAICTYCITNYMNIEKIIINKNINRDNSIQPIDYKYISNIASIDSYNILEEKLRKKDTPNKEKLDILNILIKIANNVQDLSWQEFNISKYEIKKRNINIQKLEKEADRIKSKIKEKEKIASMKTENYIYREAINENETYIVEQVDAVMGTAIWKISKLTNMGEEYSIINTIEVTTPSQIKFFENGLGFIEKPTNIYCEKSDLLITHDSGKTFETIKFPDGVFTLSDFNR